MKRIYILIILFLLSSSFIFAQRWEEINTIPAPYNTNYWLDVFFHPANPNYGWVCGFNGMVIRTTDGGNTWAGSIAPQSNHLEHVHFPTLNVGYTSGPDGIFKSTDGGQTWSEITPDQLWNYWGCYFINENIGLVIGGGCLDQQRFYRTTDGGNTWNLFTSNVPNSGLTDLIMQSENGLAYAISSGNLWVSTNGGVSWAVIANTGANVWHEEITNLNNSFLIPYAGTSCQGQGGDGGMLFTTDLGLSWNRYQTVTSMFGTFLINSQNGWACGDEQGVYHTTDAGITWRKKNCGIKAGAHLDDIWFVNPELGFVVGSGVYKLSAPDFSISKDTLRFDDLCLREVRLDSLILEHFSFDISNSEYQILNDSKGSFNIISPGNSKLLSICEVTKIVVRFSPNQDGEHSARLRIILNPNTSEEKIRFVELIGNLTTATAFPQDTLIVVDNLICNTSKDIILPWFVENSREFIVRVDKLINSQFIRYNSHIPTAINNPVTNVYFNIQLPDTGWYEERFRFFVNPCAKDTFVTIRAYGVSPIISHISKQQLESNCLEQVYDTIRVQNTGNSELLIERVSIEQEKSNFKVFGWLGVATYPVRIPINDYKELIVSYFPIEGGIHESKLVLINNDSTKVNGDKNPYIINLRGVSENVILDDSIFVDLGDICLRTTKKINTRLYNSGNIDAILEIGNLPINMSITLNDINNRIRKNDSVTLSIDVNGSRKGDFKEIIPIISIPCDRVCYLVVQGRVVSNELEVLPDKISANIKLGESYSTSIEVKSISDIDINIKSIKFDPESSDWEYSIKPSVPLLLLPNQGAKFDIDFTPINASKYIGRIVIETDGLCKENYYIDVDLSSFSKMVEIQYLRDSVYITCDIENPKIIPFEIINKGFYTDTITNVRIEPQNEIISLYYPINIPFYLESGKSQQFLIQFAPKTEGVYKATLIIETIGDDGQKFDLPLIFEYRESNLTPINSTLDFSIKEKCSADETLFMEYFNSGTLTDTIDINKLPDNAFFEMIGDSWIVPADGSVRIEVKVIPELFEEYGELIDKVSFISRVCYHLLELDLKVKSVKPVIIVEPSPIDFGEKWTEEKLRRKSLLRNIGEVDVRINKFLISDDVAFVIVDNIVGKVIKVGEQLEFEIEYISEISGISTAELDIEYSSECSDSIKIALLGSVREEKYSNLIYINKYEASAGDTIEIAVNLQQGIERINADQIEFEIEFDRRLFYPLSLNSKYNNGYAELDYSYSNGRVSGIIENLYALDLIKTAGEIVKIKGLVLASLPDNTDLTINKFEILADKPIEIEKQNGHLKLIDYCEETVALLQFSWLPRFYLKTNSVVNSGELKFDIRSNKDVEVEYQVIDIDGFVHCRGILKPSREFQNNTIFFKNSPAGAYYIIFTTPYQKETINLINIK